TYGFPLDIARDVVRDKNNSIDIQGFNNAMEGQRAKSRSIAAFLEISDAYKKLSAKGIKPEFVGYDKLSCNAKVIVIVEDGNEVQKASRGTEIEVITDFTPFYAES
ncbi:MAG: alanine--tRNA ligase, partial [Tenericutes bacterium]